MLIDFQNYFTLRLSSKQVKTNEKLLKIPPHLKRIAALRRER